MKILSIAVDNFMAIRSANLALSAPLAFFFGDNEAGKSSLNESVRMALVGESLRVQRKQDYPQIITEGSKAGFVKVSYTGSEALMRLPKGDSTGRPDHFALPFVLEPARFAALDETGRRDFLFRLRGLSLDPKTVCDKLQIRGVASGYIETIKPSLAHGFAFASKKASELATESRGAWKGITKEAYGAVKAVDWKAPAAEFDPVALASAEAAKSVAANNVNTRRADMDHFTQQRAATLSQHAKAEKLMAQKAKVPELRTQLQAAEKSLIEQERIVTALISQAGQAPREGLVHDMLRFINCLPLTLTSNGGDSEELIARYLKEYGPIEQIGDPAALAALPHAQGTLKGLRSAVEITRQALQDAEAAGHALAALELPIVAPESDSDGLRQLWNEAKSTAEAAETKVAGLKADKAKAESAVASTQAAAKHHADAQAWDAVFKALAPDGIPGEMLADALEPLNIRLAAAAALTDWKTVRIGGDMQITLDGRLYSLQSESSRWRADTVIAEAIAHLSGLRMFCLDRVDMLDGRGRNQLLHWLDCLAQDGEIETVLLFATMKAAIDLPDTFQRFRIGDGSVVEL